MITQYNRFAYGADHHDDCPCPAVAAGYSPDSGDMSTEVAEEYDAELQRSPSDKGIVARETAKEAWLSAINYFEQTAKQVSDEQTRKHYQQVAETGREIADELGWV